MNRDVATMTREELEDHIGELRIRVIAQSFEILNLKSNTNTQPLAASERS